MNALARLLCWFGWHDWSRAYLQVDTSWHRSPVAWRRHCLTPGCLAPTQTRSSDGKRWV